ncbi:hypothetical protein I553_5813 [Mycobacterium xenopi 4042]|uniref:Uncharacterized protein n=1 Tax=Mycobacterium xenopi 4042 TaxID=1299334 RepID=X7ZXC1_MYCXE|nr:hypothetical protein I553_5813 [Mycobacterium xenopi 4042]
MRCHDHSVPCRQAAANIGASDCGYLAYWIVSPRPAAAPSR